MKSGDLVRVKDGPLWLIDGFDYRSQVGLLLEIRPIEYPTPGHKQHDYIVLLNGKTPIFKRKFLERVRG
jgi:hypothetical protein